MGGGWEGVEVVWWPLSSMVVSSSNGLRFRDDIVLLFPVMMLFSALCVVYVNDELSSLLA